MPNANKLSRFNTQMPGEQMLGEHPPLLRISNSSHVNINIPMASPICGLNNSLLNATEFYKIPKQLNELLTKSYTEWQTQI